MPAVIKKSDKRQPAVKTKKKRKQDTYFFMENPSFGNKYLLSFSILNHYIR